MSKPTAVQWYENKLIELDIDFGGHKNYWIERNKVRDQAYQIEKEQSNDKINLAINEFERLKSKAESIRDIVYLDGVLAVLDSIKNETFGGGR